MSTFEAEQESMPQPSTVPEPAPLKVAIFGSCVSRDTVESTQRMESIKYVARQSMISAVAPPAPRTPVDLDSAWQRLMVQSDLASLGLRQIIADGSEADVILIDLVDERLGIRVWPDGAVATDSLELRQAVEDGYLAETVVLDFGSDDHFQMWENAAQEFISQLRAHGLEDRVLVIDANFAELDQDGNPVPGYMGFPAKHWNAMNRRYADVFAAAGFEIHRMPEDVRADARHRWGVAGYHYVPSVYEGIVDHAQGRVQMLANPHEVMSSPGVTQDETVDGGASIVSWGRPVTQDRVRSGSQERVKQLALDLISGNGHQYIGKPGFTAPSLEGLRWKDISSELQIDNFIVRCAPGATNNFIMVADGWSPPHRTVVTLGAHARDNVIIVDGRSRIYGNFTLNGTGALVAISESTRQPSSVNLALFGRDEIFFWGKDSTSNGVSFDSVDDFGGVIIGDDCMFARGIWVRTSDQHAIFDVDSLELLNASGSVVLEPHVWVGQDSAIMKNAHIGLGSVVAARALVTKAFPAYSLIAGTPGRAIKTGITWDRSLVPKRETRERLKEIEREWD